MDGCFSHISRKARDTPNFLHAAVDTSTRAPFVKERRIKFSEPTKLDRKSGIWGTHCFVNLKSQAPLLRDSVSRITFDDV